MCYRAAIFDLDGTLADTLRDIADAANDALVQVGRPPLPVDRYRYLAGQGVDSLIHGAVGVRDEQLAARCKNIYLRQYETGKFRRTTPYAGVPELLDALAERGIKLGVLSNKPHRATADVVATLFARWRFGVVRGAVEGGPLKPDAKAALRVAEELGVRAHECVYVGDTRADMLTGKGAGMFTVGVLWGFRDEAELRDSGADAIIARPMDLLPLLEAE